jgi:hypothetical protein
MNDGEERMTERRRDGKKEGMTGTTERREGEMSELEKMISI